MKEAVGDVGTEWKVPTLDETIDKLVKNGYQYASSGDVRRLVAEIERLRSEKTPRSSTG